MLSHAVADSMFLILQDGLSLEVKGKLSGANKLFCSSLTLSFVFVAAWKALVSRAEF